jgi:hypothetical protein
MLVDNVVVILGKVVVVDHNTRVKWFLLLNATYVNYKIGSILYLELIFMIYLSGIMGKQNVYPKSL